MNESALPGVGVGTGRGPYEALRLGSLVVGLLLIAAGVTLAVSLVQEVAAPPIASTHHDILAFWSAGWLVLHGNPGGMYDPATITAVQRGVIPVPVGMNGYMPFINPPFAAAVFAPLAALPEPVARAAWAVANATLAAGCCAWLTRDLRGVDRLVGFAMLLLAFPVYHALAEGQWSILLLAASLVGLAAAREERWGTAGLALSLLWLKPQFVVAPLIAIAVTRRWRAVAWALVGGIALTVVSLPFTGIAVYGQFVTYLLHVVLSHFNGAGAVHAAAWQGDLRTAEGLNGLLIGFLGQDRVGLVNALWAGLVGVVGAFYLLALLRSPAGFGSPGARLRLAAGIALVLLVNPNQFAQDCVLVLLLVEALRPLPEHALFPVIAAVGVLAALVWLDLTVEPWHLFTVALLGFVVGTSIDGIRRGERPRLVTTTGHVSTPG